ncbi:MAG TPA: sugar nucleotide-binding protein, partial [Longimicrobium sp.]|nr:sugar nucleotide-binding protein [Longimicrobium sp.]
RDTAYVESDAPSTVNVYGRSKADAERRVLEIHPAALVIRTAAFFGPWDEHNFVTLALRALREGRECAAADDATVSPAYVPDLVNAALDLLIDGEVGVWHLANGGAVTWAELARRAADVAGVDASALRPVATAELHLPAPRPLYTALASERGWPMPSLDDALARYVAERWAPPARRRRRAAAAAG